MTKKRSGVDRLARPDHDLPPARIVVRIVPGDMRIAADRVADEHGVVARRAERAVGFIGHGDAGQRTSEFQRERLLQGHGFNVAQRLAAAPAVAAFKCLFAHGRQNIQLEPAVAGKPGSPPPICWSSCFSMSRPGIV